MTKTARQIQRDIDRVLGSVVRVEIDIATDASPREVVNVVFRESDAFTAKSVRAAKVR
jgi:hypothetical protein